MRARVRLAAVDRRHHHNALIVADLSNDATYAEVLLQTFGQRVIGLQISRHGDGMNAEWRPVRHGHLPVYTIGRTYLIELFHTELQSDLVRFAEGPLRQAYDQLANLELEYRDSGAVYTCPPGKHDDLGFPARCWPGRHGICIWRHGSEISKPPASLAARGRGAVGQPIHNPAEEQASRLQDCLPAHSTINFGLARSPYSRMFDAARAWRRTGRH